MKRLKSKRNLNRLILICCSALVLSGSIAQSGWAGFASKSQHHQPGRNIASENPSDVSKVPGEHILPPLQQAQKITMPGSTVGMEKAGGEERPNPLLKR